MKCNTFKVPKIVRAVVVLYQEQIEKYIQFNSLNMKYVIFVLYSTLVLGK